MCVYIDKAYNVTFDNNVMYWARKFIVLVFEVDHYTFTNNFLTAARKRSELQLNGTMLTDDVAIYEQYIKPVYASAKINVSKNLAQGSEGEGFVFPFAPCEYIDSYPFYGNTAGSCQVAFMLDHMEGEDCICSAGLIGYASEIGLMANPPGIQTQLIYQDVFFTDNERGITLRYAHETDDNTVIVRNSYFAGYSRPGCSSCYSDTAISYCKNGYAIRMFSATIGG